MRVLPSLISVLLIAVLSACSTGEIPICDSGLTPTFTTAPKLPAKTENTFVGQVVVSFVVDSTGSVQQPVIASSDLRQQGRGRTKPVGYEESTISAASEWRYPPQTPACRHQAKFRFQVEESSDSKLGRSNNSFKPKPLRGSA
jgi:hypothetical protein